MDIIISNSNGKPIYEQISSQVRAQILSGALKAGERLPSIRVLADGLGVSVITTKRAYSDLEGEGLVETVQGKGCFVSQQNKALLRERRMRHVEDLMAQATVEARDIGLTRDQLHDMLDLMVPEDLE